MAEGTASVPDERAGSAGADLVLVRCTAPDALSNLVAVLELAADGQLRCGAVTRRPSAATVRLIQDALVAGDYYGAGEPIAAFAWPLLIQAGGLAVLAPGDGPVSRGGGASSPRTGMASEGVPSTPPRGARAGSRLELTPRGRAVLAGPSYEALGALWARWLRSVSQDELSRVEAIKGQRKTATLTPAAARRAVVAAALTAAEPGRWMRVEKLLAILAAQRPPLVVARNLRALWGLYIADSYYGSLGHAGPRTWDVLEGRYALCVLFEYAATAGLIDMAYTDPCGARDDYRALWGAEHYPYLSRYDGLAVVRVNELGAAILHDPGALHGLDLPVPRRRQESPTTGRIAPSLQADGP